jgi:tRNA(adenine34) deaminase
MQSTQYSELDDIRYMREALKQAKYAFEEDEVPVGAVIVCRNKIISRAYNQTEKLKDATAHAEMLAITSAANSLGTKYLSECCIYVTLEPCSMCASALNWSQIGRIVFGAADNKKGYSLISDKLLHPKTICEGGILKEEAAELLQSFFKKLRD